MFGHFIIHSSLRLQFVQLSVSIVDCTNLEGDNFLVAIFRLR